MTTARSITGRTPATSTGLDKGTIIGIVIAAFLIVLIVVDISCCIVNDCGLTMCFCVHCCGRSAPAPNKAEIELGEGKGNGAVTSQQITTVDEATLPDESANQEINSCDVAANGSEEAGAGKGGKVAYSEIREDGDGSAPTEAPVEKDKLMGLDTEQAPQTDEKTPMLSNQDKAAIVADPVPAADGDAKSEPPATSPASETPAEPPSISTPEQNATDKPETKGELADPEYVDY
ncbi:neural cell adhesion molecule 1-B-like [Anneissia japonica]|uniref:neural cell adhesion molecule 1-B-like n=1 Tax=Anneissia japonica TaxID=1529436 RepID=UPI0014254E24|nr:neural cell adhesion molecule 1-B-like [Anneissia japonica]